MASDKKGSAGAGGDSGGRCAATDCKKDHKRFAFCEEHFEHFKFGLIKKDGKPVSDYDRKLEHFQLMIARRKAQQVA